MADPKKDEDVPVITGLGLVTPVGYQVKQALTSMRASIMRLEEYPDYEPIVRDPAVQFPEPLIAAQATDIAQGRHGVERLLALAEPALREALKDAQVGKQEIRGAALLVSGGEGPDRQAGSRLATVFLPRLASRVSKEPFVTCRYQSSGSAGVLAALQQGIDLLRKRTCQYCIIGGVDSWLDLDRLAWIDDKRRLKSVSTVDGFVPGEAAAFVVLELLSSARRRTIEPYAICGEVHLAEEKNTIWTESPCTGEALAQCLKPVIATLVKEEKPPAIALCDLNGESYRSGEWGFAVPRTFQGVAVPPLMHPADCTGDVGAAGGAVLLAVGAFMLKMKLANWPSALVWCSSDNGTRAACALRPVSVAAPQSA